MNANLGIEDEIFRRGVSKRLEPILKSRRVDLELVPSRIEKVERIPLAVILLPLNDSPAEKAFTKPRKVFCRDGQRDVIVGGTGRSLGERGFQIQANPYITRQKVRSLVPTRDRSQAEHVDIELESSIQIRYGKRDVIDARNHGSEAITLREEGTQR